MLSEEEYKYFKKLLWESKGKYLESTLRLKIYFKFKRLPSSQEMLEALDKFDTNLYKAISFIMSDKNGDDTERV